MTGPIDEVKLAAFAARERFATGATRDVEWRLGQLRSLERLLEDNEDEIATALRTDLGRPPNDSFLGDIAPTLAEARFARKHLRQWVRRQRVRVSLSQIPGRAWYDYEPLGVVLVIGPWNYPVYLTLGPLVGAIAAGNCAIIKPSEHAPATARVLAELVPKYLDPEAFHVIEGGPEVTQAILAERMDHAFFTGGTEIGRAIMAAAAPHLTPVTLELGGKCPVLVTRNADVPVAARRVAVTKLINSGQTCVGPDYVLVHDEVHDAFLSELATALIAMSPNGDGGKGMPIVSERHARRLAGLMHDHGGDIVHGGGADPGHRLVDLTVIDRPHADSALMQEEIFGPLLPVISVASTQEAIARINSGSKPLAAYIFSGDEDEIEAFRASVPCGGVVSNHIMTHLLVPGLPFGGVGTSGMGGYHGRWGFETFSHRKAHLARPSRPDPRIVYPPYGPLTRRLLRRIF